MNQEVAELMIQAQGARLAYLRGEISREEAKNEIEPYINLVNAKSKEIAKKYGMKPKLVSFAVYVR